MILSLFVIVLLVFSSQAIKKTYDVKDGVSTIPIILHPDSAQYVSPGQVDYWKIGQCTGADYSQIQMVFILPNNPTWLSNIGYILVEASICEDSYNASCVIATNYVWNNGINVFAFSNITLDADSSNMVSFIYLRVTTRNAPTDYSFEYTYVENSPVINGVYDIDAFVTTKVNGVIQSVAQYAKTTTTQMVNNFAVQFYFVQFCVNNFVNQNAQWTATINVASTPEKSKSAFEVWACSADQSTDTCTASHNSAEDLSAVSVVSTTIDNDQNTDLTNGILIALYGIGGEYDSVNEGIISITTAVIIN